MWAELLGIRHYLHIFLIAHLHISESIQMLQLQTVHYDFVLLFCETYIVSLKICWNIHISMPLPIICMIV